MKTKSELEIHPLFIKNDAGKTTGVYLDTKTYQAMLKEVAKFDKLMEKMKNEKTDRKHFLPADIRIISGPVKRLKKS